MKPLIPIFIFLSLITCKKEYSDKRERENPVVDSIDTPKNYFIHYSIYVENNWALSHIEYQKQQRPDSFDAFFIIPDLSYDSSFTYTGEIDVGPEMSLVPKGDTVFFRNKKVMLDRSFSYTNISDTIIK